MINEAVVLFLSSLSTDPMMATAFKENPDAVLAAYSLSEEEKSLLKSGDALKIQEAIAGSDVTWGCASEQKFVRPW
jgi:hypothetical protein